MGRRTQLRLDAVVFGYFMPIGMLFVGVSRYVREELGGGDFVVGLATTIFFVSAIVARPWAGRMMDRIGRRPFLVPPLAGMAVTTALIAVTSQVWMVVLIRVVQGAMGSMLYTALAATATDLAPPDKRGAAMARLSVMVYLGFAIGPYVGEFLFGRHHWWLFAVAGALTAVSAVLAWWMPETKPAAAADAAPPFAYAALVRLVARPGVAQFTVGFGYACLVAFLTKYSREIGLGPSGGLFITFAICTLVVRAISGPAGDRFGYAVVALPGVALIGVGLASLALAPAAWVAFPAIALVGVGFGGSFPALTAIAAQEVPEEARGAALGTFLSFNDMGSALAGPLVGLIGEHAGFRWVYGAPAMVAVVGAVVVTTMLPRRA